MLIQKKKYFIFTVGQKVKFDIGFEYNLKGKILGLVNGKYFIEIEGDQSPFVAGARVSTPTQNIFPEDYKETGDDYTLQDFEPGQRVSANRKGVIGYTLSKERTFVAKNKNNIHIQSIDAESGFGIVAYCKIKDSQTGLLYDGYVFPLDELVPFDDEKIINKKTTFLYKLDCGLICRYKSDWWRKLSISLMYNLRTEKDEIISNADALQKVFVLSSKEAEAFAQKSIITV